jgi:CRP/FNR family transcriptional regulator, cyclic AMP receptor protein
MPDAAITERLRRLPLFSRLSDEELGELSGRIRLRPFRRTEVIFRKEDPGTHLYLVLEGAVKIALPGEFGQEALVAIMRPGDFFGELALFDRSPRSASAVALEDTRAALLAGEDFLSFLERHPSAVRVVLESLARTIRRLSDRVEHLTFLDVPSRVAKYLLDLAQTTTAVPAGRGGPPADGPLELSLTQDELAAFVGASRVSVNRVLGDLERREIVTIKRRRIVIKDPDRLSKEIHL